MAKFDSIVNQSILGAGIIQFAWVYLGGGLAMVAMIFVCASPPVHRRIHANDRFGSWPMMKRIPELYDGYRRNWKFALGGLIASFFMLFAFSHLIIAECGQSAAQQITAQSFRRCL
ncbi:MAG: hypothetical protein HC845_01125 [Akkermansiaceae bacterium]|nr:hypothetical protein [Akkermansiaceae bacterium]